MYVYILYALCTLYWGTLLIRNLYIVYIYIYIYAYYVPSLYNNDNVIVGIVVYIILYTYNYTTVMRI